MMCKQEFYSFDATTYTLLNNCDRSCLRSNKFAIFETIDFREHRKQGAYCISRLGTDPACLRVLFKLSRDAVDEVKNRFVCGVGSLLR